MNDEMNSIPNQDDEISLDEDLQNISLSERNARSSEQRKKRILIAFKIIFLIVAIIALILIFNPRLMFFLSAEQQATVQNMLDVNFGRMDTETERPLFSPSAIAAVAVLVLMLSVINTGCKLIFNSINIKNKRIATFRGLFLSIISYGCTLVGLIWGLTLLGINVAYVLAGLGILGMVVGLGAQSMIADIIAGFFIIFEGQFSVGDIVSIGGFRGKVTSIGMRTVGITDTGGNVKIINNSKIDVVHNLSNQQSKAVVDVGISYNASIKKAEKVLATVLPRIREKYAPKFPVDPEYIGVQNLSASSVDLRVVATVDESDIYSARRILLREIKLAFDANNIEIPFTQVVVHTSDK